MRILIYKRTHKHDPSPAGIFGNQDCMGQVRNWNYDAVIGIGGKAPWKGHEDIRYKINWIGFGPQKVESSGRAPAIVFSNFALFEEKGQDIETTYPHLFKHMFESRKRFDMSLNLPENVYKEVMAILDIVMDYPASPMCDINYVDSNTRNNSITNKCGGCYDGKNFDLEIEQENLC